MSHREQKHIVVVLGMHRSGTSAITRGLQVLGCNLGNNLMAPILGNNEKGFFEDLDVYGLNNELLTAIGSDWDVLSPVLPEKLLIPLANELKLRAVHLLRNKLHATDCLGLKDPRFARLLPFWRDVFGHLQVRVSYVIACRNPMSVARSLAKRDGFDLEKGYYLWMDHMLSSLMQTVNETRVVVDYDLLMDNAAGQLQRIAENLGLLFDPKSSAFAEYRTEFLEDSLRHAQYRIEDLALEGAVPSSVTALYKVLSELAVDAAGFDDARVKAILEQLSEQQKDNYVVMRYLQSCDERTSNFALQVAKLDQTNADLHRAVVERDGQIADLHRVMVERDGQIADLHRTVVERDGQIANLRQDVAVLAATLDEVRSSTGWHLLAPLRWYGRQKQNAVRMLNLLPTMSKHTGGVLSLAHVVIRVWRDDGMAGVKSRVRRYLEKNAILSAYAAQLEAKPRSEADRPGILFISHEATRTGAPIFLLDLIRSLSRQLDVECLIVLRSGGELEQEFRSLGPTVLMPDRDKLDPLVLHALKSRNIKLVYSNTITNGAVQMQLKELGCPIFCHVHELAFSVENFFGEDNLKRVLETTTLFLAGSKAVEKYLRKQHLSDKHIALAYPFITAQANHLGVQDMTPPLELPVDAIVVGACGTIGWRKGTDLFLQVARLVLAKTNRTVVFVWLGGPLNSVDHRNLRYDAMLMNIEGHVLFTGEVKTHLSYFAQFDIFVLPSREDPFPLVVLDAASLSIPIVCFDQAGGAPEFVEDDAGIVVPYLDIEGMADGIDHLIKNEAMRKRLGEQARRKVVERHDTAVGAKHIAQIIKAYL